MFKRSRGGYIISVLVVVFLGLLSREISFIPLGTGDMLWAVMMTFIVYFLFLNKKMRTIALISLIICYGVEFSQLYQADWIIKVRGTLTGRLVLGQGFLWSDLFWYTLGVSLAVIIDQRVFVNKVD